MIFAYINSNHVVDIQEHESEEGIVEGHKYQTVLSIDGLDPQPQVGWLWENGILRKDLADITPRQIRLALIMSGITLDMIAASLNSLPEPTRSFAIVSWEYAVIYKRTDALVDSVSALLGWTSAQTDDLWALAGSL